MIVDLVFRKQKNPKGFGTSQRKALSLQPVFQQTVSISVALRSDIQSMGSRSEVKMFLIATKYCVIK